MALKAAEGFSVVTRLVVENGGFLFFDFFFQVRFCSLGAAEEARENPAGLRAEARVVAMGREVESRC